jgi:RNA polymerase sigma factor (sigma-70 family)
MGQRIALNIFHRNRLFRDCLATVLSGSKHNIDALSLDHDSQESWSQTPDGRAQVALVDMQLPNDAAVPLIQVLTGEGRKQKVLVLVAVDDHESIVNCVAAGAQGCVLEEASLEELKVAIERVVAGEAFCSQQLVSSMFQQLAELSPDSITTQRAVDVNLTPRERQILQLMADKMTNQEIADELSLSLYTVKNHVHNILEKLQVDDRFDAIEHARQRRLLPRVRPMPIAATRR